MDPQFKEVADEITRNVTAAVTAVVNAHVSAVEARLSKQAHVNVEAVKSEVRLAAEGYAASLDSLHRRFDDMEKDMEKSLKTRLDDHDLVLKNHGGRITTLEQK